MNKGRRREWMILPQLLPVCHLCGSMERFSYDCNLWSREGQVLRWRHQIIKLLGHPKYCLVSVIKVGCWLGLQPATQLRPCWAGQGRGGRAPLGRVSVSSWRLCKGNSRFISPSCFTGRSPFGSHFQAISALSFSLVYVSATFPFFLLQGQWAVPPSFFPWRHSTAGWSSSSLCQRPLTAINCVY